MQSGTNNYDWVFNPIEATIGVHDGSLFYYLYQKEGCFKIARKSRMTMLSRYYYMHSDVFSRFNPYVTGKTHYCVIENMHAKGADTFLREFLVILKRIHFVKVCFLSNFSSKYFVSKGLNLKLHESDLIYWKHLLLISKSEHTTVYYIYKCLRIVREF